MDETLFTPLYADIPSRPNTPVNQLFSLEVLKSGFGRSDAESFDHLEFDVHVRYALGVRELELEICDPRTIYDFLRRVSQDMQTRGVDVFAQAFEALADAQCVAFGLETQRQRMDSSQISSKLLVEVLQRAARMLTPADQERYTAQLHPYAQGPARQYCYRLKSGAYATHLEQLGHVLATMLTAWEADYADEAAYRLLQRVFHEHFSVAATAPTVLPKPTKEKPLVRQPLPRAGDYFSAALLARFYAVVAARVTGQTPPRPRPNVLKCDFFQGSQPYSILRYKPICSPG